MSKEGITTTQIGPEEWEVLRRLKIESLDQEPIAFEDATEGKQKYLERTEEEWRSRLSPEHTDRIMVFAKDPNTEKYVGTVSAYIKDGVATIQHMYVDNAERGRGIGKQLLADLLAKVKERQDVNRIELQVLETQTAAINLYHSLGFKDTKRIEGGAKRGTTAYNEIEMVLE